MPDVHRRCTDDAMAENDELTASDLKDILVKDLVWTKCSTVSELLQDCEMTSDGPTLQLSTAR